MANGSTADKARKARNKADDAKYGYGTAERSANKIAKSATGKDLTYQEEERAGNIIYGRRVRDTARTAARANFIERRTEKKASSDRIKAAVGGGAPKKQAPKPATKKAVAKPKTIGTGPNKAKVTPMPSAKSNAKGLPKTGRQNVKKSGK